MVVKMPDWENMFYLIKINKIVHIDYWSIHFFGHILEINIKSKYLLIYGLLVFIKETVSVLKALMTLK